MSESLQPVPIKGSVTRQSVIYSLLERVIAQQQASAERHLEHRKHPSVAMRPDVSRAEAIKEAITQGTAEILSGRKNQSSTPGILALVKAPVLGLVAARVGFLTNERDLIRPSHTTLEPHYVIEEITPGRETGSFSVFLPRGAYEWSSDEQKVRIFPYAAIVDRGNIVGGAVTGSSLAILPIDVSVDNVYNIVSLSPGTDFFAKPGYDINGEVTKAT